MPIYEFFCLNCKKRFEKFISYSQYGKQKVDCPYCQSQQVKRRISRIRMAKSEESRLENFGDPSQLEGLEKNPQALGRMMRRMSSEVDEEMGPEFNEVVGRLEKGQSPEQIEKELPDLGTGGAGLPPSSNDFDSDY